MLAKFNASGQHGRAQGCAQLTRIEAGLFQQEIAAFCAPQVREQASRPPRATADTLRAAMESWSQNLYRLVCAEGDALPGKRLNLPQKFGVKAAAVTGEGKQARRVFRILDGKHPTCSPGGLFRGFARLQNGNFQAAMSQDQGAGEADDPAACNRNMARLPHDFDCSGTQVR